MFNGFPPRFLEKLKSTDRVRPREFVNYTDVELTIEDVKEACERHFSMEELSCDILVSDQGPSCTSMEHIPDLKVIHVRFINETSKLKMRNGHKPIDVSSVPSTLLSDHDVRHSSSEKSYLISLSVSYMLKLGTTLKPDDVGKILGIYSFNIETIICACIPQKVESSRPPYWTAGVCAEQEFLGGLGLKLAMC